MADRLTLDRGWARMQMLTLWLLLGSIFAHALIPVGSPLKPTTGSAFSASTLEVALAPGRKPQFDKQVQLKAGEGDARWPDAGSPDAAILPQLPALVPAAYDQTRPAPPRVVALVDRAGAASFQPRAPPIR